jgi:uncharacterized membrane protein
MWLIGALLGALLASHLSHGSGLVLGALIGGFAGWLVGLNRAGRLVELERRVSALESASPQKSAPAAQPAPAVFVVQPAEQAQLPQPAQGEPAPVASRPQPAPGRRLPPAPKASPPLKLPPFVERLLQANIVAKVGILVLFFGLAFLVKYAYERVHVPIELRLSGVALGAIALLVVGWRLRAKRAGYALALQGGGIAILYLVIFGAFRLWGLLPAPLAFGLLVGIAVASAILAVAQNSLSLAVIGVSGGFLAPVLASTGQGSHVMLFSYYAVLNVGIVAVAWLKAWRVLNVLGFAFTFVIGLTWGAKYYRPEHFATTEPFLVLFFLMYIAIPLLFARRRAVELKDYVDGTLVFGVPLVAFGSQAALVKDMEYGAAYSAFALALFYLALATALFRRTAAGLRLLVESYIALSLAFGTLAIPLAFDGRPTSAAWALEGAAIVWIGTRQGRLLARLFGHALQFAAGIAFLADAGSQHGPTPVLNSFYLGTLFVALAALFCSAYAERNRERLRAWESALAYVLLGWGALWWYAGGVREIVEQVAWDYRRHSILALFAGSSAAFSLLSTACRWPSVRWLCLLFYPAIVLLLAMEFIPGEHPFAHLGWLAWPIAFAVHFWLLARHAGERAMLIGILHALGVYWLALLLSREVGWQIDALVEGKRVWPLIAWALVPATMLAALGTRFVSSRWPVAAYPQSYVVHGGAPLAVFLALWALSVNFASNGDPYPLAYLPILNPLDIAIGFALVIVAAWLQSARALGLDAWYELARPALLVLFGILGFICVNGVLLRTLHHWADVPFALEPMLRSRLVQAAFSILWTTLALAAMVFATRRAVRALWIAGAVLMAVVVAKLFLVDLAAAGTVERIVSFIVVGVLMLLIGYFSPVPPGKAEVKPA